MSQTAVVGEARESTRMTKIHCQTAHCAKYQRRNIAVNSAGTADRLSDDVLNDGEADELCAALDVEHLHHAVLVERNGSHGEI
jgi:hypothetical protein